MAAPVTTFTAPPPPATGVADATRTLMEGAKALSAEARASLNEQLTAAGRDLINQEGVVGEEEEVLEVMDEVAPPPLAPEPVIPKAKAPRIQAASVLQEQYGKVLTGPVQTLYGLVQGEEPAMTALLEATQALQIVPEGEFAKYRADIAALKEQLVVANHNVNSLRAQLETSKSQSRAIAVGAIRSFAFEKTDGKVGRISKASTDKILSSPERVERVATMITSSQDNASLANALRGYVQSLS